MTPETFSNSGAENFRSVAEFGIVVSSIVIQPFGASFRSSLHLSQFPLSACFGVLVLWCFGACLVSISRPNSVKKVSESGAGQGRTGQAS